MNKIATCDKCASKLKILNFDKKDITCPKCQNVFKNVFFGYQPEPLPTPNNDETQRTEPKEVGWIVVHDEYTACQTLPLALGDNVIGRKSTSKPCDVMIDTHDSFMSRQHAVVSVKLLPNNTYQYTIKEHDACKNGIAINLVEIKQKRRLDKQDVVYLNDGATLQLGGTKVVLKTVERTKNAHDATKAVSQTDFNRTVLL